MKDPRWEMFAEKYKYVVVVPPLNNDPAEEWINIAEFALRYQLSTNSGMFSRYSLSAVNFYSKSVADSVAQGRFDSTTIYVVNDLALWNSLLTSDKAAESMYLLDGYRLVAP
jgi:hypothetical protein